MRIRATVAALTGALALSALAVPSAHAATAPVLSKVTVNGGKDIVLGTTVPKTVTVSVTASHASGIATGWAILWHGASLEKGMGGALVPTQEATCKNASAPPPPARSPSRSTRGPT